MMRWRSGLVVASIALATCAGIPASAASGLEPYKMVRSLQLVQDRIAGGDHAAMPMQRHLLEMIDSRLLAAAPEDFARSPNLDALLVYAMSGGNPTTVELTLARLELEAERTVLAAAVRAYALGDQAGARDGLTAIEPRNLPPELGASVALVKGTVLAVEDPAGALDNLAVAQLLSPGSLVEEAALRRALQLAVSTDEKIIFERNASRYVRRFLRSPYATQFADSLLAGLSHFRDELDMAGMREVLDWMSPAQAQSIVLRLSRKAAIENDPALRRLAAALQTPTSFDDPRALLYSSLGTLASEGAAPALRDIERIDRSRLSHSDRVLLEAAEAVAAQVVTVPDAAPSTSEPPPASSAVVEDARARLEEIDVLLQEARR